MSLLTLFNRVVDAISFDTSVGLRVIFSAAASTRPSATRPTQPAHATGFGTGPAVSFNESSALGFTIPAISQSTRQPGRVFRQWVNMNYLPKSAADLFSMRPWYLSRSRSGRKLCLINSLH